MAEKVATEATSWDLCEEAAKCQSKQGGASHGTAVTKELASDLPPQGLGTTRLRIKTKARRPKLNLSNKSETFSMKNPYFQQTLKHYNIRQRGCYLSINASFARTYLPMANTTITLLGPNGVGTSVTYKCGPTTYYLLRGWSAFVRAYDLIEGDTCFFEVVGQGEMKVQIERGAKK